MKQKLRVWNLERCSLYDYMSEILAVENTRIDSITVTEWSDNGQERTASLALILYTTNEKHL